MTYRILVVEDQMARKLSFVENLFGHKVLIVDRVCDAKEALITEDFDIMFLDRDLSGDETSDELVKWLCEERNDCFQPSGIIIHSANTIAGPALFQTCKENFKNSVVLFRPCQYTLPAEMA